MYDRCLSVVTSWGREVKRWAKVQIWGLGWGDIFKHIYFLYFLNFYMPSLIFQIYFVINHIRKPWRVTKRDRETEKWSKGKRAKDGNSFTLTLGHAPECNNTVWFVQIPLKFHYESGKKILVILNKEDVTISFIRILSYLHCTWVKNFFQSDTIVFLK